MTNDLTNDLTKAPEFTALTNQAKQAQAGKMANDFAARSAFGDYQGRKAANTTRRQSADLALFADFLRSLDLEPGDLENDPEAWRGITWGLVDGFVRWQLVKGYAVGSVNIRLTTVKTYAKLATKAGVLPATESAMIATVKGYGHSEAVNLDKKREADELPTRKGDKKAAAVSITTEQAARLMSQPDNTAQGRRDNLLMALMLEHGLRVGEVAILKVTDLDAKTGTLTFYRPKVKKAQTHKLTTKTLKAAREYFTQDAPAIGSLWRGSASKKDGKAAAGTLTAQGMSERAITKRVEALGQAIGISGLSAHDLRHYWATQAARKGTPVDRLQDAGGWNSPAMPLRYVEFAKIANDGVKLE